MEAVQGNRNVARYGAKHEVPQNRRKGEKSNASMVRPCQFLSKKYLPKKSHTLEDNLRGYGIDLGLNLDWLHKCTEKWAIIHGLEYTPKSGRNWEDNVRKMFTFIMSNIGGGRILNIDYVRKTGRIEFFESEECDFPSYSLFFMPIACLDYLEGPLRELMVLLFNRLISRQGFNVPEDHWDFGYGLGLLDNYDMTDEELEETYSEDYISFYKEYRKGGHIYQLFEEITSYNEDHKDSKEYVQSLIQNAINENGHDRCKLIDCIEKGLALIDENSLDRFDYYPGESLEYELSNDSSEDRMLMQRLMCLCYGNEENDPIVDNAIQVLNSDASNYCEFLLYDVHRLTPEDTEAWTPSDFPYRFNEWYKEMYNLIESYEPRISAEQGD